MLMAEQSLNFVMPRIAGNHCADAVVVRQLTSQCFAAYRRENFLTVSERVYAPCKVFARAR